MALVLAGALLLAACGDDDDDGDTASDETTTSAAAGGDGTTTTAADGGADAPDYDCTPLASTETVTVGENASAAFADYWIAKNRGYFTDENIELEATAIQGGSQATALLGDGQLDVALGGFSANTFNALESGISTHLVMGLGGSRDAEQLSAAFVVRSDLVDSGEITEIADLRGRPLSVAGGAAGPQGFTLALVLEQGGLTLADVQVVTLGRAETVQALENGAVDGAVVSSPFVEQVVADGTAEFMGDPAVLVGKTTAGYLFGPGLDTERQPVGCAFLRALFRARELLAGDYLSDETVLDDFEAAGFPRDQLVDSAPFVYTEDGEVVPEDVTNEMFEAYKAAGLVTATEPPDPTELINYDAIEAARASLEEQG